MHYSSSLFQDQIKLPLRNWTDPWFCVLIVGFDLSQKIQHLGPATDFYKKLALDCSAQQIAVDLFFINAQYADVATIGEASTCV